MKNTDTIWAFAHISKTGGTSLRQHFIDHLEYGVEFIHLAKKGDKQLENLKMNPLLERRLQEQLEVKVVCGHELTLSVINQLPHQFIHTAVTFRDPRTWITSRYNQRMNRIKSNGLEPVSFKQWLDADDAFYSQFDWLYAQFFEFGPKYKLTPKEERLAFIESHLKVFNTILLLERLDEQLIPIFETLGLPTKMKRQNVTGVDKEDFFNDTASNKRLINEFVSMEVALYEKIKNQIL